MVTLEQVRLLETKVAGAIDYVKRVTEENGLLKGKLDGCQRRISELEGLVQRFKEDQGRIEDGILAALDRLSQFEDAIDKSLTAPLPAAPAQSAAPPPAAPAPAKTEKAGTPKKPETPPPQAEAEGTGGEELDIF